MSIVSAEAQAFINSLSPADQAAISTMARAFSMALSDQRRNELVDAAQNDREVIRKITLTPDLLGSARSATQGQNQSTGAYKIPFQFKSVRVQKASGADVEVELILGKLIDGRSSCTLRQNDTLDLGQLRDGWLYWEAQPNESMEIIFGIDVNFKQGSLITEQAGGVFVSDGSNLSELPTVTVDDTAGGTQILAANPSRARTIVQNPLLDASGAATGNDAVMLGASGLTQGVILMPGAEFEYRGTAALFGLCATGLTATLNILEMEI